MSEGVESATSARKAEPARSTEPQNRANAAEKKEIGDATNRVNGAQVQGAAREVGGTEAGDDFRNTGGPAEKTEDKRNEAPVTGSAVAQAQPAAMTPEQKQESDKALKPVAAGETVLKRGSQGPAVAEMQRTLNTAMPGANLPADGKFGPRTEQTVQNYQRQHGLSVDGRIDRGTLDSLRAPNAAQMQADPAFQKLDPQTQRDVTGRLEAARKDPAARRNIASLTSSEGFGKMGGEQQQRMLAAQGTDPKDSTRTTELKTLANSPSFQGLSGPVQNAALEAYTKQAANPAARSTIARIAGSPGFAGLNATEQQRMLNLISGNNQQVSQPARAAAQTLVNSPAFTSGTAAQQTQQLRDLMTTQPGLGVTVQTNGLTTPQTPFSVSAPTAIPNHPFSSGPAPAQQYQVTVDGRQITVTMPATPNPAAGATPTIEQVAQGIASLPKSSRDLINSVTVNPAANPADAHWGRIYGQPGFRSYMTAGAAGDINVYPSAQPHHQGTFTDSLVHETGHTASQRRFGVSDRGPGWNAWRAAAASDGLVPSTYARASPQEDFSETLALYQGTRNNPATAAELRRLFPERFRILDSMFGGP
jgi:hypothetical protein